MKIRVVGAESFHADGRTDRHNKDNSRFLQFFDRAQTIEAAFFFPIFLGIIRNEISRKSFYRVTSDVIYS
jgi:hypothetical protein